MGLFFPLMMDISWLKMIWEKSICLFFTMTYRMPSLKWLSWSSLVVFFHFLITPIRYFQLARRQLRREFLWPLWVPWIDTSHPKLGRIYLHCSLEGRLELGQPSKMNSVLNEFIVTRTLNLQSPIITILALELFS